MRELPALHGDLGRAEHRRQLRRFTVAFGPKGDLNPNLDRVTLRADWGDTPLTEAQCAKARLAATGWGARCIDEACSQGEWEKIGVPKQRAGTWDSAADTGYIGLSFASTGRGT